MWKRKNQKSPEIPVPSQPVKYPIGTFVWTERGFFYIQNTRRLKVSERVLMSWNPRHVVKSSEAAVAGYRINGNLMFRNGTLIEDISESKVYLIEDALKRQIVCPDVYELLGIRYEDRYNHIIVASSTEAAMHKLGSELL